MDSKSATSEGKKDTAKKTPEVVKTSPVEQKLLPAPKEVVKKITNDFFDFSKQKKGSTIPKLVGLLALVFLLGATFYFLSPHASELISFEQKDLVQGYIPVSNEPKSMHLEIQNPDDELLLFDKTVVVSGKTSPKSSIVISNGDVHTGTEADEKGHFQKVVDIHPGINEITIQAFDTQGNTKSDSRTVYYSEEKL